MSTGQKSANWSSLDVEALVWITYRLAGHRPALRRVFPVQLPVLEIHAPIQKEQERPVTKNVERLCDDSGSEGSTRGSFIKDFLTCEKSLETVSASWPTADKKRLWQFPPSPRRGTRCQLSTTRYNGGKGVKLKSRATGGT